MMRRLTSSPKPSWRVCSYMRGEVAVACARPVAHAVVAGQVGARLGGGDHVVGGQAEARARHLDRLDPATELLDLGERVAHHVRHSGLEALLFEAPDAEAQAVEPLGARHGDLARDAERGRVARVAALEDAQHERGVRHVARQRAALVERRGERDHPVARDGAVGGLHADDAAQRRGLADRAARVRADRPGRVPAATAAALPPLEPPGTRVRSQGFCTGP